jgi:hypothetical protein
VDQLRQLVVVQIVYNVLPAVFSSAFRALHERVDDDPWPALPLEFHEDHDLGVRRLLEALHNNTPDVQSVIRRVVARLGRLSSGFAASSA